MTVKFLRPNPEKLVNGEPVKVRDNVTGEFIPAEGKNMRLTFYWLRLMREGDVLEGRADDPVVTDPPVVIDPPVVVDPPVATNPPVVTAETANPTLSEAIDICLKANDGEHLNKSGKPDCNVLSALTGRKVTAADRDAELATKGIE